MQKPKYRASLQVLKEFSAWMADEQCTTLDFIDYLNEGIPIRAEEQVKADSYSAVFKMGVLGGAFSSDLIQDAKGMLPRVGAPNFGWTYQQNDVEVFGVLDFMGFGTGVMLESTNRYTFPQYLNSPLCFAMKGMERQGLKELVFLTSDGITVHRESYTPRTYDYSRIEDQLEKFAQFLADYDQQITNRTFYNNQLNYDEA